MRYRSNGGCINLEARKREREINREFLSSPAHHCAFLLANEEARKPSLISDGISSQAFELLSFRNFDARVTILRRSAFPRKLIWVNRNSPLSPFLFTLAELRISSEDWIGINMDFKIIFQIIRILILYPSKYSIYMIVIIVTKREIQSYLFVKKLRVFFFVRLFYLATVNGENLIIEVTNK